MAKPIVIVNCKTYPQATGANALKLAKLCEAAAKHYGVDIRIAVQATDIALVASVVKIPVYAQHVDAVETGKATGWLTAHAIKHAGARGALLNHAEHPLSTSDIKKTISHLRKAGLTVVVCAENVKRLREIDVAVTADLFAVEPPELIGGNTSVTEAKPEAVASAVKITKRPVLVGAGIKSHKDYLRALELGAKGVLLSSSIVLARNQKLALKNLLE